MRSAKSVSTRCMSSSMSPGSQRYRRTFAYMWALLLLDSGGYARPTLRPPEWAVNGLARHRQLALPERATGLPVEEVELGGIDPDLGLTAAAHVALRGEARHGLLAALGPPHVARAGVLLELLQLLGLHALGLDHEVDEEIGAHRLHHVDLRAEGGSTGTVGLAQERGVLHMLGPDAHHELRVRGHAAQLLGHLSLDHRQDQAAVPDVARHEVHRG